MYKLRQILSGHSPVNGISELGCHEQSLQQTVQVASHRLVHQTNVSCSEKIGGFRNKPFPIVSGIKQEQIVTQLSHNRSQLHSVSLSLVRCVS